ncbi:MAG: class I SAM-dependent methyltransferase [Deltaproteobacteria bacterium]|nr:class I SAM-dependent methyltransferase [Deltaproteobacteria bacterium]
MGETKIPDPAVMPVDREAWWRHPLHLVNFMNAYATYRDLRSLDGVRAVLIVGPGQGLDTVVLRWQGFEVTTLDIDELSHADHIGSVHEMNMFGDRQFDVVVASHVLEHFAAAHTERALAEIARVGRYALIYLPVHGRHLRLRLTPGVRDWDWSVIADVGRWWERPDGLEPRYCEGQHFWEVGLRGFRVKDLERRLSAFFEVIRGYRNPEWLASHNFVLRSRRWSSR